MEHVLNFEDFLNENNKPKLTEILPQIETDVLTPITELIDDEIEKLSKSDNDEDKSTIRILEKLKKKIEKKHGKFNTKTREYEKK